MKSIRYLLIIFVAIVLLLGAFSGGILVGWTIPGGPDSALGFITSNDSQSTTDLEELSNQSETPKT